MSASAPAVVPTATPISRYPAWAMLDHASMRLTLSCSSAPTLPTTIVATASAPIRPRQSPDACEVAPVNSSRNAPIAAAFVPVPMKAVTGVGAPSYTSGVHMWKGTALALKPRATTISTIAAIRRGSDASPPTESRRAAIPASEVVPVTPYSRAKP